MIKLEYNIITGCVYYFEPVTVYKQKRRKGRKR